MDQVTYIVVTNKESGFLDDSRPCGPLYTRDSTRALLLLLGCKLRHCFKVVQQVFETTYQKALANRASRNNRRNWHLGTDSGGHLYLSLPRQDFNEVISQCLATFNYRISPTSDDLKICCSLRERRRCVTILLAGTSGCGKSTLASLLAGRLGIPTVVSTDSIRHILRGFHPKEGNPLLWASTYSAGESFDESKTVGLEELSLAQRTIKGYKAQCELVLDYIDKLITRHEERRESLVVEGVHLSVNFLTGLMQRHPSVIPFLVYIKSEGRHTERMAVRAKYMTLDPSKNRYVKHMKNIRQIQDYLVRKADKRCIPKVENTNIDRSVAIIHTTVLGCLKRTLKGEPILDASTMAAKVAMSEYMQAVDWVDKESSDVFAPVGTPTEPDGPSSSGSHAFTMPFPIIHRLPSYKVGDSAPSSSSSLAGMVYGHSPEGSQYGDSTAAEAANGQQASRLGPAANATHTNQRDKQRYQYGSTLGPFAPLSNHGHNLEGASSDDDVPPEDLNGASDADTEPDEVGLVGYGSMYESTDMDDHEDREDDCVTSAPSGVACTGGGGLDALHMRASRNEMQEREKWQHAAPQLGGLMKPPSMPGGGLRRPRRCYGQVGLPRGMGLGEDLRVGVGLGAVKSSSWLLGNGKTSIAVPHAAGLRKPVWLEG